MAAHLVDAHPVVALVVVLAAISAVVSVAFLVGLAVLELEWRIRSRRARRRGGQVDLTGVRL